MDIGKLGKPFGEKVEEVCQRDSFLIGIINLYVSDTKFLSANDRYA